MRMLGVVFGATLVLCPALMNARDAGDTAPARPGQKDVTIHCQDYLSCAVLHVRWDSGNSTTRAQFELENKSGRIIGKFEVIATAYSADGTGRSFVVGATLGLGKLFSRNPWVSAPVPFPESAPGARDIERSIELPSGRWVDIMVEVKEPAAKTRPVPGPALTHVSLTSQELRFDPHNPVKSVQVRDGENWQPLLLPDAGNAVVAADGSIELTIPEKFRGEQIQVSAATYFPNNPDQTQSAKVRNFCFEARDSTVTLGDRQRESCGERKQSVSVAFSLRGSTYAGRISATLNGPRGEEVWPNANTGYFPLELPESITVTDRDFAHAATAIGTDGVASVELIPAERQVHMIFIDADTGVAVPAELQGKLWPATADANGQYAVSWKSSRTSGINEGAPVFRVLPGELAKLSVAPNCAPADDAGFSFDEQWKATISLKCIHRQQISVLPVFRVNGQRKEVSGGSVYASYNDGQRAVAVLMQANPNDNSYTASVPESMRSPITFVFVPPPSGWQSRILATTTVTLQPDDFAKASGDKPLDLEMQIGKPAIMILVNPSARFARTRDPKALDYLKQQAWRVFEHLNDRDFDKKFGFRYFASTIKPGEPIAPLVNQDGETRLDDANENVSIPALQAITFVTPNKEVSVQEAVAEFRKFLEGFSLSPENPIPVRGVLLYVEADESRHADEAVLSKDLEKDHILVSVIRAKFLAEPLRTPAKSAGAFRVYEFGMGNSVEQRARFAGAFDAAAGDILKQAPAK